MTTIENLDWADISKRTAVIILGGGQGTRLYPLTKERSKPAVPIAGKFRLIDLPISNCIHSGLEQIFVLTQFNSDSLHRHISQTFRVDPFSDGFVQIIAAQQTPDNRDWYQGTADAVRQALKRFTRHRTDYVLILSGDHLYRMDYRQLMRFHFEKEADVTIPVLPVERERCKDFGILQVNKEGRIQSFEEKPKEDSLLDQLQVPKQVFDDQNVEAAGRDYIASMGIYMFDWETLYDALMSNNEPDFGKHIIPQLLEPKRVMSYFFVDYWEDIGTIHSFYEANLALTHIQPEFNFYDQSNLVYSRPRFLPAAKINGAYIRSSLIADGAIVSGSKVEESVIGLRGIVAEGAELFRTVMMGADYYDDSAQPNIRLPENAPPIGVGSNTIVRNAIIDKNARIGANCRITNEDNVTEADGQWYYIRDGIVVIPKNAIIFDGSSL